MNGKTAQKQEYPKTARDYLALECQKQFKETTGQCEILAQGSLEIEALAYMVFKSVILKDFPSIKKRNVMIEFKQSQSGGRACYFSFYPPHGAYVPDSYKRSADQ